LPLQEADLKSYDAFKKAMRADLSKITNTSQIKFWVYKDIEMVDLQGKKNKIPAFLLLVDDSKARNFLRGKSLLCTGTCRLEQSRICLEPVTGKLPFAALKVSVPLLLGKPLYIPSGQEEDQGGESVEHDGAEKQSSVTAAQASAGTGSSGVRDSAALKEAWGKLVPRIKASGNQALMQAAGEVSQKLSALVSQGKLAEAQKLVEELTGRLAQAKPVQTEVKTAAGAPYQGIVKYRQALLGFAQAKSEVKAQIGALKSAILKIGPQEADFADDLAAELEELNDELADAVDEAMQASENEASPATDAVKLKIRKYLTELASNPLVQKVESNPLGVKVTIGKTLGGALARIKDAMPA
jgi:hypothetical protein